MVDIVVLVDLLLLILSQQPLIISHVLVLIQPWLQFEGNLVVLLDLVKVQLSLTLPVIPTATDCHLLGARDLLGLEAETVEFTLEAGRVLEDFLELVDVLPLLFPVVTLRVVKQSDLLILSLILSSGYFELPDLVLNLQPVYVNLVLHTVKLVVPASCNIFLFNHRLRCILSEFLVGWAIFVALEGSSDASLVVLELVGHEIEAVAFEGGWIELEDCVLEATCAESDDRSAGTEELMLHDPSRLKHRRHKREITADIDQRSIREEEIRVAPEAIGVLMIQKPHLISTILPIILLGVSTPTHQKLYIEVVLIEE